MTIEVSRQAKADIRMIGEAIALSKQDAALRFLDTLYSKFQMLEAYPRLTRPRGDLGPGVRQFPVGNYLVFYRPISDGVEILRVLHGRRDIKRADIPNLEE